MKPADLSDPQLVEAYLADLAASDLGVDYFLAQEMEKRGFRSRGTAELTALGQAVASSGSRS